MIGEMKMENKRTLKWYHGILVLALVLASMFFVTPIFAGSLGFYASFVGEMFFLLASVFTVLIAGGDFKKVFPFSMPRISKVFGTLIMWLGSFLAVMGLTILMTYFFPEEVTEIGSSLNAQFTSVPFLASLFVVAVSPAVCEEAVFRGVLLRSIYTDRWKWAAIFISGLVFGFSHGGFRWVPTAFLGWVLAYICLETGNIFYSMLFHFVNNAVPLFVAFSSSQMLTEAASQEAALETIPIASVGIYMVFAAGAPMLLYIGSYLLHKGDVGAQKELFGKEKQTTFILLLVLTFAIAVVGLIIFFTGVRMQPELFGQF